MPNLLTSHQNNNAPQVHADVQTLLLMQKTELISELTRAMANQFNNIMMAITSYAELEMKTASGSERHNLEQVMSNAGRATALIQKLLAISRKRATSPQPLDLNHLLSGLDSLLGQLAGEQISVVYKLDPSIPVVSADSSEVEQVVLSLAINARHAMAKGGTLTASTKVAQAHRESLAMTEIEHPGNFVLLSIDDTGYGRTTEESGGTQEDDARINSSLAAVRGIVKNFGGYVRFTTEPGKGNSVQLYFPTLKKDAGEDPKRAVPRNVPVARTILVVEDDDAVRIPTSEFLKMEGFKVLQAKTGDEAIQFVLQNRSRVDVLITDIVMPKMSGRQVAERLLELHSDLKILYMSGDADAARPVRTSDPPENAVLRKPFRLETLKDRIHELLGE